MKLLFACCCLFSFAFLAKAQERPEITLVSPATNPYRTVSSRIRIVCKIKYVQSEKDVILKYNQQTVKSRGQSQKLSDGVQFSWDVDLRLGVNEFEIIALNDKTETSSRLSVNYQVAIEEKKTFAVSEWKTLVGHTKPVISVLFADKQKLVSVDEGGVAKLWSIETGKEIESFATQAKVFATDPAGKILAGGNGNMLKIWALENGKELYSFVCRNKNLQDIALTADGKFVAGTGEDLYIEIRSLHTGQEVLVIRDIPSQIKSLCFSADGKSIAAGCQGSIIVWSTETGQKLKTLTEHNKTVTCICYSPDGKYLASGSNDNSVKIWSLTNDKSVFTFTGHEWFVLAVGFSFDGKFLASGSADKKIKIWDLEQGKAVFTINAHAEWVFGVNFSPDGKFLASAGNDKTVKIWKLEKK